MDSTGKIKVATSAPAMSEQPSSLPESKASLNQSHCTIRHALMAKTTPMHRPTSYRSASGNSQGAASTASEGRAVIHQLDIPDYESDSNFLGLETGSSSLLKSPDSEADLVYNNVVSGYQTFHYNEPFPLKYNDCVLPELNIAYETWGEPNHDKSNAVLVFTGVASSSHASSHKENPSKGWWEKFIGAGCPIDTNKFFVICCNHIGGCSGTTGPSSINPITGQPYGTTFPLVSVDDLVKVQYLLLDHLGIDKVHAAVGASLGGMCSLMTAALYPDRIGRVISISSCAQAHASTIAQIYLQSRAIMADPNWQRGHYYGTSYPKMGMKLARELGMITFRSGPEWKERFGRKLIDPAASPSLCPSFEIESYIRHQGETFYNKHDPNSLLYLNKALTMFDMGEGYSSLQEGMSSVRCPVLVLGVQTDILFPIWQQRELVSLLTDSGNEAVSFYELSSICGHDTFLIDLTNVGGAIKGYLETELKETGYGRKRAQKYPKS